MNVETVATGLAFPEGPVAMADGSVLLVEMRRRTLSRVTADGAVSLVAELGGGPNGAALGPDGKVYICNNGGRFHLDGPPAGGAPHAAPANHVGGSIQRVDLKTGAIEILYEACDGRRLLAPNDLAFDAAGGFWFTDHGSADQKGLFYGGLYYASADGSGVRRVRDHLISPNGIGLSPDEKVLYVADTRLARLIAFDVADPGALAEGAPRIAGAITTGQMFDSLAVEADGRVCVATVFAGAITTFAPCGDVESLVLPDGLVTNICFGGADMRDAWITGAQTGALFRCRWPRAGHRLNFQS